MLPTLFDNTFLDPPSLVSYNHPHDLLATTSSPSNAEVSAYRLPGHLAFTIKRKNLAGLDDVAVTALEWKVDGSLLAVGWSDGVWGVYSGEKGAVVGTGDVSAGDGVEGTEVRGFRWTRHEASGGIVRESGGVGRGVRDEIEGEGLSTEEWYDGLSWEEGGPKKVAAGIAKLTRHIATLDATAVLPRLSALPAHGLRLAPEAAKFCSQASTDTAFEPSKDSTSTSEDETVDVLTLLCSDSAVRVYIDNTLSIGSLPLPPTHIPRASTSHPSSTTHSILTHDPRTNDLFLNTLALPVSTLSSPLLQVITTNTKRLAHLSAYLATTVTCLTHDYTTALAFPTRLLNNLSTELEDKGEGDVVTNLLHLAMTTHFTPAMLEWLVDIVRDTNAKRWSIAIEGMYANVLEHLFMHLRPALDRVSIAAATLRGYAIFDSESAAASSFNLDPALFSRTLDAVDAMRLVCRRLETIVVEEQRAFRAFAKWVRVMIEVGTAGVGTKAAAEAEEREAGNVDFGPVGEYICGPLGTSRVEAFVERRVGGGEGLKTRVYDRVCEVFARIDGGRETMTEEERTMTNIPTLMTVLSERIDTILHRIAAWQSNMLSTPTGLPLPAAGAGETLEVVDMSMSGRRPCQAQGVTSILLLPAEARTPLLEVHYSDNPRSSFQGPSVVDGVEGEVLDATFIPAPSEDALALIQAGGGEHPYQILRWRGGEAARVVHAFEDGFVPKKLVVGGREGKMVCIVLGDEGKAWRVLDLQADGRPEDLHDEAIGEMGGLTT